MIITALHLSTNIHHQLLTLYLGHEFTIDHRDLP